MATDPILLERIRNLLTTKQVTWSEKRMFGGDCFMVDEKMCFGTYKGGLMARVDPQELESLAERPGAGQMIHGGRPMTGYLFIASDGYDSDTDLSFWIDRCLAFNPRAKSSKRKK